MQVLWDTNPIFSYKNFVLTYFQIVPLANKIIPWSHILLVFLEGKMCLSSNNIKGYNSLVAQMVRNLPANPGWIPGLGRSPGEGNGNPLQYSCLENPMDRGAW